MNNAVRIVVVLAVVAGAVAVSSSGLCAAEAKKPAAAAKADPIKVVILVGGHGYDKKNFPKAWGGHEDIQCEVWKGKPYTVFDDISKFKYDVILTFNLSSGINEKQKANLLKLLAKGTGLVAWHHSLANCQNWPEYEKIAGCKFWMRPGLRDGKKIGRSGTGFGRLKMHIADANHPITKGMKDFEIQDETYNKQTFAEGIHVLVTTEHPKSDKAIAWVHKYSGARVFGYQGGHDAKAWTNPGHRQLLCNGIRWVAGRIGAKSSASNTFKDLTGAVSFIATSLDKSDLKTLADACSQVPKEHVLKQLGALHRAKSLPKLYVGRKFPANGDTFKLGGHAKELGHIHIDFTRQDGAWRLKAIWLCR